MNSAEKATRQNDEIVKESLYLFNFMADDVDNLWLYYRLIELSKRVLDIERNR